MEINRQGAIIIPAEDLYEWLEEHSGKFVQGGNIVKSEDVLWLADRPGVCQFKLVAVDSTE